ncbi:hypothetical protein N329_04934, partial [Haliaeetus albicilla]
VTRGVVASGATGSLWYSVVECDFVVQVLCVVGRGVVVVVDRLAVVTARVVARVVVVVVGGSVVVLTVGRGVATVVVIGFLTVLRKFPLGSLLLHLPAGLAFCCSGYPHRQGFHLRKGNSRLL